ALPPFRYALTYSSISCRATRSTSVFAVGFDPSTSFLSLTSAPSPSFSLHEPTLHVFRSAISSGGIRSAAKSSARGGLLIFFVTRKLPPFSNCSMSLTAARYRAAGAATQIAPSTATSCDGSASSIFVAGCPARSAVRWSGVSFATFMRYESSGSGRDVGGCCAAIVVASASTANGPASPGRKGLRVMTIPTIHRVAPFASGCDGIVSVASKPPASTPGIELGGQPRERERAKREPQIPEGHVVIPGHRQQIEDDPAEAFMQRVVPNAPTQPARTSSRLRRRKSRSAAFSQRSIAAS